MDKGLTTFFILCILNEPSLDIGSRRKFQLVVMSNAGDDCIGIFGLKSCHHQNTRHLRTHTHSLQDKIHYCQASGPGPGLCLIHFNSFISLRLKTLDQRADAIIQMHPPTTTHPPITFQVWSLSFTFQFIH